MSVRLKAMYNAAARDCAKAGDYVTQELFIRILGEEEGHIDLFANIRDHLDQLGDAYLVTLMGDGAE